MTIARDSRKSSADKEWGYARADGAGRISPLQEGYRRKGGQNPELPPNATRPPPPPPFRPSSAPPVAEKGPGK